MKPVHHPFESWSVSAWPRLVVLLGAALVLGSFFMPWLQMEVVPVEGRFLPELAAEYYGKGHLMVMLSYLIFVVPLYALFVVWRMVYNLSPGSGYFLIPIGLITMIIGAVLVYFDGTDTMNIHIRFGYFFLLAGVTVVSVLVWNWQRFTSGNAAVP